VEPLYRTAQPVRGPAGLGELYWSCIDVRSEALSSSLLYQTPGQAAAAGGSMRAM
jgi:hypothetical protein